ncbi:hypothetical protein LWI28_020061 [Acer negundo]|uniref:DUF1985 domain-containing protein n=1 Tax=Acer negundo TaxID=4023 RepID=A0AAD5JTK1_ACENE|nr:hypothetical protein LWI28_020061 [Acer negundo]
MQMRNQLKDSLKTPEKERYSRKITRYDHFDDLTDIDNTLNKVHEHLAVEERHWYTESCFGHLLRMYREMKFSASIVHRLLIRELHHNGPKDEMRFDFYLKAALRISIFSEQYDAVKLCLLYMLNWILMGLDERVKVPIWQFRLVEDLDAFDAFPWGTQIFAFDVIPELDNSGCGKRREI